MGMDGQTARGMPDAPGAPPTRCRGRTLLVIGAALVLLLLTATAVTAAAGWPFSRSHQEAAPAQPPQGGPHGGFPGREGVVTAVDESAKTLTIAGIPGVTTVTVDTNVKLTAVKPDGTTQNVALGDFRIGQVVRVRGTIDRSQFTPGQRPAPTKIKLTVTEIIVPPAGVATGAGLVTAVNGNTITVVSMGGLTLKVTPAAGAMLKKMDGSAFTV